MSANLGHGTAPGDEPPASHPLPPHGVHGEVAHQFDDPVQEREAATLGMWSFLATEVLFFGGLFVGYAVYRFRYDDAFALASRDLKEYLGAVNTAVLLISSLTMAMAVRASHRNEPRPLAAYLIATCVLGLGFLGIKAIEWTQDYHEGLVPKINWQPIDPGTAEGRERDERVTELAQELGVSKSFITDRMQLFFVFYFCMTGLHGLHMVIGASMVSGLIFLAASGRYRRRHANLVEVIGLYWHFIDIVWIFLFPILYLVR